MEVFRDPRATIRSFFASPKSATSVEDPGEVTTCSSSVSEASYVPESPQEPPQQPARQHLHTVAPHELSNSSIRKVQNDRKKVRDTFRAYNQLQQEHIALQAVNKELQQSNDHFKQERAVLKSEIYAVEQHKTWLKDRYRYVVQEVIYPYAQDKDAEYEDDDAETMVKILHPLVQDAMQAEPLRGKVKSLQTQLQASRSQTQALQDQNLACEKEVRALQEKARTLEHRNEIWQAQVQDSQARVESLQGQEARWQAQVQSAKEQEKQWHAQMETLQEQTRALQEQTCASQEQVQVLQKEMLARVEKVEAVSDEQFAQTFRTLVAAVKSLSRSVRFSADADLIGVLHSGALLANVQQRHRRPRAHQKYFVEAWTWSVLLDKVFANPLAIYGKAAAEFADKWTHLFDEAHFAGWPSPTALCEKNRYTMTAHMAEQVGEQMILTGTIRKEDFDGQTAKVQDLVKGVYGNRNDLNKVVSTRLAAISSALDVAQISVVVDKAFALALQLSLQKCRLQVTYPVVGNRYDKDNMSSMPDLDGDDVEDGYVAFVVNPGLTKWGDANGNNLDHRYDIVPALVQLEDAVDEENSEYGFDARKQVC